MNPFKKFRSFSHIQFNIRETLANVIVILCSSLIASCGNGDAKLKVKKFYAQIKMGDRLWVLSPTRGKWNSTSTG
jgi:hypothetical protein